MTRRHGLEDWRNAHNKIKQTYFLFFWHVYSICNANIALPCAVHVLLNAYTEMRLTTKYVKSTLFWKQKKQYILINTATIDKCFKKKSVISCFMHHVQHTLNIYFWALIDVLLRCCLNNGLNFVKTATTTTTNYNLRTASMASCDQLQNIQ